MSDLEENKLVAQRREKLAEMRESGNAFPNTFQRDSLASELHDVHDSKDKETLEAEPFEVAVAGRLMLKRVMGKISFATLQDMSGRIQLVIQKDHVGEKIYAQFKTFDIGDIVGVKGAMFKTQKGELSVKASTVELLTKALRPLPEKFHGLSDQEERYRQRYVDLIMNQDVKKAFVVRSKIISRIRDFFNSRGFLEVETPMMQVIPGGATARPFITHHNALDMDLYLRIAPELYLKRLVVGGFEQVYEINRNFRNEGLSTRHNPEFTMLEFYQAYAVYEDLMDLTETLLRDLAQTVLGTTTVTNQGVEYDLSKPFLRMTVKQGISKFNPDADESQLDNIDYLKTLADKLEIKVEPGYGAGKIQFEIFEKTVEPNLMEPTFITQYPTEVSPLARRNDDDPSVTDRFEFFVGGREIANGFSELNDAEDQAERFNAQVEAKDSGDDEAMHFDADYIRALEYGLPPTAGEGIGIDRLVMFFTDSPSIRDVLLFPHMRPEA